MNREQQSIICRLKYLPYKSRRIVLSVRMSVYCRIHLCHLTGSYTLRALPEKTDLARNSCTTLSVCKNFNELFLFVLIRKYFRKASAKVRLFSETPNFITIFFQKKHIFVAVFDIGQRNDNKIW